MVVEEVDLNPGLPRSGGNGTANTGGGGGAR